MFLAQTAQPDYDELSPMDILGLQDTSVVDQNVVHEEFLEHLKRDQKEGWYESGLPWKGDHPPLPSNEANSLKRLGTLVQRLKKTETLDKYDAIIQLKEGIVERATEPPSKPVFYLPHHPVIRESAESTKMRIVYDASTKTGSQPSLNDCLNTGPPLQNQLFKVLVRGRFHPVALNGDIRKAFFTSTYPFRRPRCPEISLAGGQKYSTVQQHLQWKELEGGPAECRNHAE